MNFLFWTFLIGIIIASLQDLKRREVDDWLNILLLLTSFTYLLYTGTKELLITAAITLIIMYFLHNILYYIRMFAGGDAKLLFAMTALFITSTLTLTLINIGIFIIFLLLAGSLYGLGYTGTLYIKHYSNINKEIKKEYQKKKQKKQLFYYTTIGVILFILGLTIQTLFIILALFTIITPHLLLLSKTMEKVAMIKKIPGKKLREGDWLVKDIKTGKHTIKANWDGLTNKEIKLLQQKKQVWIKDGIPFVPAFLIAFLAYHLLKEWMIGIITIIL